MRFNKETCRWEALGETAEVRMSSERASVLDVLKSATEAMTPANISYKSGISAASLRNMLCKMVKTGDVLKAGRGLYAQKDNPDFVPKRKTRFKKEK